MNKQLKIFFITSLSIIVFGGIFIVYHFQSKGFEWATRGGDNTLENPYDATSPNESELLIEGEEPKGDKKNGQSSEGSSDISSGNAEGGPGTDRSLSTGTSDGTTNSGSDTQGSVTDSTGKNSSPTSQTNEEKQSTSKNQTTSTGQPSTSGTTRDQPATGNPVKKQSVTQITKKYKPTINKLQEEVDSELDTLVSRAKKDYSTKKSNGENIDYGYFYNKYMSSIVELEAQTDAEFNGIMSSLEKDLQANGHKKSNAQSLRDDYEAQKNARRDNMQSEIMGN